MSLLKRVKNLEENTKEINQNKENQYLAEIRERFKYGADKKDLSIKELSTKTLEEFNNEKVHIFETSYLNELQEELRKKELNEIMEREKLYQR